MSGSGGIDSGTVGTGGGSSPRSQPPSATATTIATHNARAPIGTTLPGAGSPAVHSRAVPARLLPTAVLAVAVAACAAGSAQPSPSTTTPPPLVTAPVPALPPATHDVVVERGLPVAGPVTADVFRPAGPGPWPLVVLLPGGNWSSADPAATEPLARELAGRGAVVVNSSYRLTAASAFADVACAMELARERAAGWGADLDRLVLAGHSAGAHVAAVAAFAPVAGPCTWEAPRGYVGLAGPYDIRRFAPLESVRTFFGGGPAAAADAWAAGDPYDLLAGAAGLDVALVHGRSDLVVLPVFAIEFADALREAGSEVELHLIAGANHNDLLQPGENAAESAAVILAVAG